MGYILFHKDTKIIAVYEKQPNRTYHTIHTMEEIATEEELVTRISEIDSEYVYETKEMRRARMEEEGKSRGFEDINLE